MSYAEEIKAAIRADGGEVIPLLENMTRLGAKADEIAGIPDGFFDGVDVRRLNTSYLPPELGGLEILQDGVTRCVMSEMLGYADAGLSTALPGPSLVLSPLLGLGSDEQRREFLGRFDSDQPVWGAFAITEPGGGSDATRLATTAEHEGDGYRLNGEKCFIGNGGRASFYVVFATTDPTRGQFGIQPFVVDRDTPGLEVDDSWPMLGLRALRVAHLRFEDCWVPERCLLGQAEGRAGAEAFLSAQRTWEYMRPGLSGLIVGALERLLDEVGALAEEGGDPRFRRTMAALVERVRPRAGSARLLAHHAAALFGADEDSAVISSMAKVTASNLARATVAEVLAVIGDAGLELHDTGRDVQRWARDFQAFELLEGTTEVHQLMITRAWSVRSRRRRVGSAKGTSGASGV